MEVGKPIESSRSTTSRSGGRESDRPPVTVVILNFNGGRFIEGTVRSVLAQDYPHFEVLLVDNGSTDGSVELVREAFPNLPLHETGENLGYAGGNNVGVEMSRTDLIVLLNVDTVVASGWLSALVDAIEPEQIAIVASFVRTGGVDERDYEKNGSINLLGHNVMRVFNVPSELFYAGGTSLIYQRSLLSDPPFDADFFAYAEDVYLGLRALFAGYRIVMARDSHVEHVGGGTVTTAMRPRLQFCQERNRLLNLFLFFDGATIAKAIPLLLLNCAVKCLAAMVTPRRSLSAVLQAHFWILRNRQRIRMKRVTLRAGKKVTDAMILRRMSARLVNGDSIPGRIINGVSILYHRIVGLRTIEIAGEAR